MAGAMVLYVLISQIVGGRQPDRQHRSGFGRRSTLRLAGVAAAVRIIGVTILTVVMRG